MSWDPWFPRVQAVCAYPPLPIFGTLFEEWGSGVLRSVSCYWWWLNHADFLRVLPSFSSMLEIVCELQCQGFLYISSSVYGYGPQTSQLHLPCFSGSPRDNSISDYHLLMSYMSPWASKGLVFSEKLVRVSSTSRGHISAHYSFLGIKGPHPSITMAFFMVGEGNPSSLS